MDAKIFRVNYKSDFILTLTSDAGWMTPFCIKFWTGSPSQAYYVSWDGETYTHCTYDPSEPTKLTVQFDDHHLPIGDLKFQVAYHFTVADFPNNTEDEVINQANITTEIDGEEYQLMLDFNGETAPEIQFSLPAYANEAQRIANEQQRIANEQQRIANEDDRIQAEETRQYNEQQRIQHEEERVSEFARLKSESEAATTAANAAATLANEKAALAADKASLAQAAATLANEKAQLAADKAALAAAAATLANDKAALAQQKAAYAQAQGDYAKAQGDYAKAQGDTAQADHERAEADHTTAADDHQTAVADHETAASDHTRAEGDHTTAASDHSRAEVDHSTASADHTTATNDHTQAVTDHTTATSDHTQAGSDHTRAESDHTRAESDHAAVEVYVDSLGAFDISAYHATGGVLAKYADLTAALGTGGANIPEALRKGGMSVKFVQSSDNNYVQFRCLPDEFTTDITKWAICDEGVYVENSEFVYIKADLQGRIAIAIKKDGSIFFGAGVPPQIIKYVQQKIEELSLDEYEDIVTFLGNLIEGDKTLQQLLNEKVDKVDGKSLINSNVANSAYSINSPEFLELKTDSENKILEGFEKDGAKHVYVDEKVEGSVFIGKTLNVGNYTINHENDNSIKINKDSDERIIENMSPDGTDTFYTKKIFKLPASFEGKIGVVNSIGANALKESVTLNVSSMNALNPFEYYYPRLVNMNFPKKNTNTKPLVLCHISDVHGQEEQYNRIVEFLKLYNGLYDDVIITGDIVMAQYDNPISYLGAYDNKALLVIGNHDAWERNALPIAIVSAKDDYDKFFAPFIDNWKVTQPDNAASGKCYYYKDYPQSKIRMIIVDCMHNSDDQTSFVESALSTAITNDLSVIMVQHYPAEDFVPSNVPFQSIDVNGEDMDNNDAYVDAVDTFIEGGGKFICWLCGHHHVDLFGYLVGHPNQLQICIDCTKFTSDFDTARLKGTKTQDVMNIYSFNVETGTFSILRVGCTLDRHLQKKDSLIVDYINKNIINN